MYGARVCHAHGGRAPQVREAAKRRATEARVRSLFVRMMSQREVEQEAIAPWAAALGAEAHLSHVKPDESARRLRAIATQMSRRATELRGIARDLEQGHD